VNLRYPTSALLLLVAIGAITVAQAQTTSVQFAVRHEHRWGSCEGILRVDSTGITYETPDEEHARTWPFRDIRQAEFRSSKKLELRTYGKPETWKFELLEGEWSPEAYALFSGNVERVVTSRVLFPAGAFVHELPVRHRHRHGGCEGVLRIGPGEIVYDTGHPEDRRIWRMRDLRSFGSSGAYNLRLTTEQETFNFDLKQALEREVYDYLWAHVYERPAISGR